MLTMNGAVCSKAVNEQIYPPRLPFGLFLTSNLRGQMYLGPHCVLEYSFGRHIVGRNAGNYIKSSELKRVR